MTLAMNLATYSSIVNIASEDTKSNFLEKYKTSGLKNSEVEDLTSLVSLVCNQAILEGFHIGFKINQIGEEFDLLKVTTDRAFNIELKKKSTLEAIEKQQERKYHYLKSLNKNIIIITYVAENNSFFLKNGEGLEEITLEYFICLLNEVAKEKFFEEIDNLFSPSNYLVSPFNNTTEFVNSNYFLTNQQNDFSKRILLYKHPIQILHGPPGTGKTLLLYDLIRKEIESGKSVMTIHCGQLNTGHNILIGNFKWKIRNAHRWIHNEKEYEGLDVIFIDEAQRLKKDQLESLIENAKYNNIKLIFSIDPRQYLHSNERRYKNFNYLSSLIDDEAIFELSKKIRTNKEIATFTQTIFSGDNYWERTYDSVTVEYLRQDEDFDDYIHTLQNHGWIYLPYTNSQHTKNISYEHFCHNYDQHNSHKIIGQEFDKVIIFLDQSFLFDETGNYIKYRGPSYYDPRQMLFQNITRTREALKIIVHNNPSLFESLIQIVTNDKKDNI
ncbi:AAA family ATPase [Salinicoccus sp. HZC-1]|uniref:AAA family ATPase n=1 Tax=Salinicoccus sp. HZC-1 TaxID=3385497 RepID=UPI00398BAD11